MKRIIGKLFCGFLLMVCQAAVAQTYPSKGPVKLVVGFAPGGGTDTIARTLNVRLSEILKQSVIVENRAGAGGVIATDYVAKSTPDGYTISFTLNNHAINQALYPKLPFDTEKDLRGVTLIGALPQLLAAHPLHPRTRYRNFYNSLNFLIQSLNLMPVEAWDRLGILPLPISSPWRELTLYTFLTVARVRQ